MRALLAFLSILSAAVGAAPTPTVAELVGSDPFSLVNASGGIAVSLQDSRTAAGTRAILAEYLRGRRADQLVRLSPSGEPGYFSLTVNGTARVLELQDVAREPVVSLADPSARDGQKWRIETTGAGRYRVVSKLRGLVLGAAAGVRPVLTAGVAAGTPEQTWWIALHPSVLAGPEAAAGGSLAGRFPSLARQLVANRESWLDHQLAAKRLEDYCSLADAELWKGMGLLVQDRVFALAPDERNHALTLLLWLLSQACYTRGDSATVALALANASLYAQGDEAVRSEVRRDVVAHYRLYRSVTEWQQGWAVDYRLAGAPLLAKVLWCYRSNQLEQNGAALTLEEYRTFVDRIDVLTEMHAWVKSHDVSEAASLRALVLNVDALFREAYKYAHFMAMIRQWYAPDAQLPEKPTDDELYAYLTRPEVARLLPDWVHEVLEDYRNGSYYVEVLGRRRDPQARMWLNYQWELHGETGFFRGDCGTEAEVSMALWKASGLVALAIYHTGKDIGHAYAMYYDPFVGRFRGLQDLSPMVGKYGPAADVTLHPMPLRLHDQVPLLQPRPRTTVESYTRFVSRGIDYALMERMYLSRGDGARPAAVFSASSCPAGLPDADRDGLCDEDEATFGTRADDGDTDGDGFSDPWEIERRFNPREAASPGKADLGRVLVGHVVRVSSARSGTALAPAGATGSNGPNGGRATWRLVRSDESQYHFIVAPGSGLCLGVGDGGQLVEGPLAGSASQKWKLLFRDGGTFVIQSRVDGKVMALEEGRGVVARDPQGTRDELWVIR